MKFTPIQIKEIVDTLDRFTNTFVAHHVGVDVLSTADKLSLSNAGIDWSKIPQGQSKISHAFKLGLLSDALGDDAVRNMSYDQFKKYLSQGKMFKLNSLETAALQNLKLQTYNEIDRFGNKIKQQITDKLVYANKSANLVTHNKLITDKVKQAIVERKSVQSAVSEIGHSLDTWNRDFGRIADFVMHTAFDEGRAINITKEKGQGALVYKDVYLGACNHCIKSYLTGGVGSAPQIFTISELQGNATNVGRKVKDWKPVIGPLHPWCYDDQAEVLTNEGWKFFKDLSHTELFLSVNLTTGHGEWTNSINKVDQHYKGPMYHFHNKSYDLMTTPNHKHVIKTHRGPKLRLINTLDLPKESQFLRHIPEWIGNDLEIMFDGHLYDSMDFCEWMGWYLSEGSVFKYNNWRVNISQHKYIDEAYNSCLKTFPHRRVTKCNGYIEIGLLKSDVDLINYLQVLGHSHEKFIPQNLKEMSPEYIKALITSFHLGDGSIEKGRVWGQYTSKDTRVFHTSSKLLADDIGECLLKIGQRPSFFFEEARSNQNQGMWLVRECKSKFSQKKNMTVDIVDYDGMIYDVELVENHTLVIRRNGKVVISGNCRCTLMRTPNQFTLEDYRNGIWMWNGKDFVIDSSKRKRKVERKSKVTVTVDGQKTII